MNETLVLKNMNKFLVHNSGAFVLAFVLTDMFFFPVSFATGYMSAPVIAGIAYTAGTIIASVITIASSTVKETEGRISVMEVLHNYPVQSKQVKKVQYMELLKAILIQCVVAALPQISFLFFFSWAKFIATMGATILSMLFAGVVILEINNRRG